MASVEQTCNTSLTLGLGSLLESSTKPYHTNKSNPSFPSLSLALSSELLLTNELSAGKQDSDLKREASSISVVSSFSNANSVKKEKERDYIVLSGEEDRVGLGLCNSSRVITSSNDHDQEIQEDDIIDNEKFGMRKKLRLSKDQSFVLEESFKEHNTLNPKQKQELAKRLNLRPRQVEVWFQNRRARTKLKQTKVNRETLKRYCETLADENKRLKNEIRDLQAFKGTTSATQFYMQLSTTTITLCPSCQRIYPSTTV